jgi:hypothetical protein
MISKRVHTSTSPESMTEIDRICLHAYGPLRAQLYICACMHGARARANLFLFPSKLYVKAKYLHHRLPHACSLCESIGR